MEALNWMDPDLVETPRDSPALQQAPAPDAKKNTYIYIYIHFLYTLHYYIYFFIVTFVVRHVNALSQNDVLYLNEFCVL